MGNTFQILTSARAETGQQALSCLRRAATFVLTMASRKTSDEHCGNMAAVMRSAINRVGGQQVLLLFKVKSGNTVETSAGKGGDVN